MHFWETTQLDPETELDLPRIVEDLAERYRGTFSAETVERYVAESHELLSSDSPRAAAWVAHRRVRHTPS